MRYITENICDVHYREYCAYLILGYLRSANTVPQPPQFFMKFDTIAAPMQCSNRFFSIGARIKVTLGAMLSTIDLLIHVTCTTESTVSCPVWTQCNLYYATSGVHCQLRCGVYRGCYLVTCRDSSFPADFFSEISQLLESPFAI